MSQKLAKYCLCSLWMPSLVENSYFLILQFLNEQILKNRIHDKEDKGEISWKRVVVDFYGGCSITIQALLKRV